jgi:voltage-gated potassium channel
MENKSSFGILSVVVLIFSLVAMCCLIVDNFFVLSPEIKQLLQYFDFAICIFFFFEFFYQLLTISDKKQYLKWGWIDLLSSIPMIDAFRYARVVRVIRIIRIIRTFKTINSFLHHFYFNKAKGALTSVFILAILMLLFTSIAILQVETDPNSNIKTAEDALWWSYTTITTVGYGDKFPITTEGRLIAIILMTFGVGMFGTFTAYIASLFVKPTDKP